MRKNKTKEEQGEPTSSADPGSHVNARSSFSPFVSSTIWYKCVRYGLHHLNTKRVRRNALSLSLSMFVRSCAADDSISTQQLDSRAVAVLSVSIGNLYDTRSPH